MDCNELHDVPQECEETVGSSLKLLYFGRPPITVRGPITRNLYHFSELEPAQIVDKEDAGYLLATTVFGIAQ